MGEREKMMGGGGGGGGVAEDGNAHDVWGWGWGRSIVRWMIFRKLIYIATIRAKTLKGMLAIVLLAVRGI